MPKVFLSWSGKSSLAAAEALFKWLPAMLQSVKPFMSTEGLRKGGRWNAELADELEQTKFGIICLTRENLEAPWILFEAGAISKFVDESQVAPLLIGVQHSDLPKPLTQFNATTSEKEDFRRLVRSINASSETEAVPEDLLALSFEACWPKLEEALRAAVAEAPSHKKAALPVSDDLEKFDAILQELLVLARTQSQLLGSPQNLFPLDAIVDIVDRRRRSQRGLPEADHGVWEDLDTSYIRLTSALDLISVPSERKMIQEVVDRLRGPVHYILGRVGTDARWSTRRREQLALERAHSKSRLIEDGASIDVEGPGASS